jgi:hypothetical protein
MAQTRITSDQLNTANIVGVEAPDYNPLPTTYTDVASSSVTFTAPVASFIYITFGARFQKNTILHCYMRLVVDGTASADLMSGNGTTSVVYDNAARTVKLGLTAGSHTIKLQSYATTASAAVAIAPYWYGTLTPQ